MTNEDFEKKLEEKSHYEPTVTWIGGTKEQIAPIWFQQGARWAREETLKELSQPIARSIAERFDEWLEACGLNQGIGISWDRIKEWLKEQPENSNPRLSIEDLEQLICTALRDGFTLAEKKKELLEGKE